MTFLTSRILRLVHRIHIWIIVVWIRRCIFIGIRHRFSNLIWRFKLFIILDRWHIRRHWWIVIIWIRIFTLSFLSLVQSLRFFFIKIFNLVFLILSLVFFWCVLPSLILQFWNLFFKLICRSLPYKLTCALDWDILLLWLYFLGRKRNCRCCGYNYATWLHDNKNIPFLFDCLNKLFILMVFSINL